VGISTAPDRRHLARLGLLLLPLLGGCAAVRPGRAPDPPPAAGPAAAAYRVGCPDVLEVAFPDRPDWDAVASIGLDGRLPLEQPSSPRVEGLTLEEVRAELARAGDLPPDRVNVWLAAARSGKVYVHGPIRGMMRVMPYQGPEPVLDFLNRISGLPPGSQLSQVYVVRPNVATGGKPEVFRVDPDDPGGTSNIKLQPADQVYVGETRGSSFARTLPPWLRGVYRRVAGLLPDEWRIPRRP
jgi:protein involved in polysaccharide export with SLBB domain